MMRILSFVFVTLLFLGATHRANAAELKFDITVQADATKSDGTPWDGVAALGNSKANLNALPDIAVCIIKAYTKPACIWRPEGRRLFSQCQNSTTCKFPGVALQPLPIGIVIIDIDVRNHDIVDVVILTGNENDAANAEIKESLRGAMSVLAPNHSEDTKERLVRGAKVMPLADCSGKACRLTQSELKLDPRE